MCVRAQAKRGNTKGNHRFRVAVNKEYRPKMADAEAKKQAYIANVRKLLQVCACVCCVSLRALAEGQRVHQGAARCGQGQG